LIQIIASFSVFNISQGSVATHLRWGGIFINNFIAQFQLSTSVKELWQEAKLSLGWPTVLPHSRLSSTQLNSNGKTQGNGDLILDHKRMWRNIKLCWY